jgi:hypothetical protein
MDSFKTSYCLLSFIPVPSEMTDISETSIFDSINDAKAAITHLATLQKRPVVVVNSRPTQFHIKCKDLAAPLKSLASKEKMERCISLNS